MSGETNFRLVKIDDETNPVPTKFRGTNVRDKRRSIYHVQYPTAR